MEEVGRKSIETELLNKVEVVISTVEEADSVNEVICALHSIAVLLFPLDPSLFVGCLDRCYRDKVLQANPPPTFEQDEWQGIFYHGAAFPALARVLLRDVASNWLPCFPLSARTYVYDMFFINGHSSEVVQAVVPYLRHNETNKNFDYVSICSNAERLLVLCILENKGVQKMAKQFGNSIEDHNSAGRIHYPEALTLSLVARLITSIPDKAKPGALSALSSRFFFHQITLQLFETEGNPMLSRNGDSFAAGSYGTLVFIGEVFSHICRRGAPDVILSVMVPRIVTHVKCCLASCNLQPDCIASNPGSQFWLRIMEAIGDPYVVERMSEGLLRLLVVENVNDTEAYWVLWMLFHRSIHQQSTRAIFLDKFLLWKVFPICCLKWILRFSVFESPLTLLAHENTVIQDAVLSLLGVWSRRQFLQSAPMEQQAYITAALGLCLEQLSREKLEKTALSHSVLRGISCRLENPDVLVRRMASAIGLVFSKIIDPSNPLYLEDDPKNDVIDWEFGYSNLRGRLPCISNVVEDSASPSDIHQVAHHTADTHLKNEGDKRKAEWKLIDPNEIVDPACLSNNLYPDEDYAESLSDTSSDKSLQPYDLSDDDSDLRRSFSQISELIIAMRKSDDPDGVENALCVAEDLIRALPEELRHFASDLVKALLYIRCSEIAADGKEESMEERRKRALVALVASCPFDSLHSLVEFLYSPHVDTSQRILILDVMTDAAEELASVKVVKRKHMHQNLVSPASNVQAWFSPSMKAPIGAGPWREVSQPEITLRYTYQYERELPLRSGQAKLGKSRKWGSRTNTGKSFKECSENRFPLYGAAFMLPAMQGFDKKRHGVDLLGQDFIILGKLIYMLGTCMKCMAIHPEACAVAPMLLDMLSSRKISGHAEAYVRKSVLFAAACILQALHPSYVASALVENHDDVSRGLDWIRTWALQVADTDPDSECVMMAVSCLQLHGEMGLDAFQSLESYHPAKAANAVSSRGPILIHYSGEIV